MQKRRLVLVIALFLLTVSVIALSWYFSGQDVNQSNEESKFVAQVIENIIAQHFPVNHNDSFWRITFNMLLRKFAHFMEYYIIGAVICTTLNVLTRRVFISSLSSGIICIVLAFADEYRQRFSQGRTPRIFDVKVDTCGALLGILLITVAFIIYRYIQRLKLRIKELENCLGEND